MAPLAQALLGLRHHLTQACTPAGIRVFPLVLSLNSQRHYHNTPPAAGEHAPVIIAGAGPSGLVLALQLAKFGVRSVVLEKSTEPTKHPQAHFINNRTMEVFRHLDGLASEVSSLSPPLEEWRRFVYCRSLSGELLGQVDHFTGQSGPQNPSISPEPLAHLPQSRLLPLLLNRAARYKHLIELRQGTTVTGFEQSTDGVRVRATGVQGQQLQLQGSFLAAADGAYSSIRTSLGIPMVGDSAMQQLINIHFFSKQLGKLAAARPGMLYFVFNARVVTVMVAHTIQEGEFVAQVPYFPPLQSLADFTDQACTELIRAAAGLPNLADVELRQVNTWTMSAEVAERFRQGRVFLVGDAAHRFPPAGGFGMNTGVQDAHNLAWKLAAVLRGHAGPGLLDSYEAERKQVAQANTALSVANWREAIRLPQALGLDPRAANLVNQLVTSAPLPQAWGKQVLEGALGLGRAIAATPLGPIEPWRKQALHRILTSGETLRLQFPREDLGFVYKAGALVPEPPSRDAAPAPRGAPYVPTCAPGARLPHCWVEVEEVAPGLTGQVHPLSEPPGSYGGGEEPQQAANRMSTLDLVASAAPSLTLLVDCGGGHAGSQQSKGFDNGILGVVQQSVRKLPEGLVQVVAVVYQPLSNHFSGSNQESAGAITECIKVGGVRVVHVDQKKWQAAMGTPAAVLLVRPDGHVAWRWFGRLPPGDLEKELLTAARSVAHL